MRPGTSVAVDPVCGMTVDPPLTEHHASFKIESAS